MKGRRNGFENTAIGVELGHSPRVIAGYVFVTEYEHLKQVLPRATFVNALDVADRVSFV